MSSKLLKFGAIVLGVATLLSFMNAGQIQFTQSQPAIEPEVGIRTVSFVQPGSFVQPKSESGKFDQSKLEQLIPDSLKENPLSLQDQQKATELAATLTTGDWGEWLGPLAPIAISPFFGIACLCGISQFGGDFFPANSFVSTNPVLNNPAILWTFVILTLLTSLPRLTKVSKPAAQAIDQLETYAGIITILVIRFLPGMLESADVTTTTAMVQMGFLSFSTDVLLAIAAIINIIVINSVKFFFEVMVWLVPIPFVDAALEAGKQSTCAGLMAIYAWSPFVATLINLVLFVLCLLMFGWIKRQVSFLRSMIGDPVWAIINKPFGNPTKDQLVVFPKNGFADFKAKSKLVMRPTETGWEFIQTRLLFGQKRHEVSSENAKLVIREGFLINSLQLTGDEPAELLFSRRYHGSMAKLAGLINAEHSSEVFADDLRGEFAKA